MYSIQIRTGEEIHSCVAIYSATGIVIQSYEVFPLNQSPPPAPPGARLIKVVSSEFGDVMWGDRAKVFLQSPTFEDIASPETRCAWMGIGSSVHRCLATDQTLSENGNADYILPETAAFLRAIQCLYGDNLPDYPCIAFLFITPTQLHVFVFQFGELMRYTQERVSDVRDLDGLRQAAEDLAATINGWQFPPIDTVLVGGHHPNLHSPDLGWLPEFSKEAVVDWISPEAALREDFPDAKLGTPATPTAFHAVPLLVLGAGVSAETGWGADYNTLLSPIPAERVRKKPVSFKLPSPASPVGFGAVLGLITMALVCFITWNTATKRENLLKEQLKQERLVEVGNRELQMKCDDLVRLKRSLDDRAKWIQGNRDAQPATNSCFTLLRQNCPVGIVYTRVQLQDKSVTISGFASVGAFYGTGKPSQALVDLPSLVTQLSENLRGTGKFTEIEPVLKQNAARDQVDFTITCNFTSPITPTSVRVPPLSDTVLAGSGGQKP